MLSLKLTLARTASQITKDTIHPAQIIFSIDIFQTWIIPLHAHLQVIYYVQLCKDSSISIYLFRRSWYYEKYEQTDRQGDSYIPPKMFLQGV